MEQLQQLAQLLAERNALDAKISAIIGRPAQLGHIGEYLVAAVFGLALHESATHRGSDGCFRSGSLAGRSVNVKWYPKLEGLLDINPVHTPDNYLVLAGPRSAALSSRGATRPVVLHSVFLFDVPALLEELGRRGVKVGVATSVQRDQWERAEVYPTQRNPALPLRAEQRALLATFATPMD